MHRNDELILMGKQDQIDHFIQGYPPLTALAIPPICSHRDRYNPLNMDALIIVAISHKAVRPY